ALDRLHLRGVPSPAFRAFLQHLRDEIHPTDPRAGQVSPDPLDERPRPATDVEDLDRLIARHLPDPTDQRPLRRTEQQPLEDAAVVALAPAHELVSGLMLVVRHDASLRSPLTGVRRKPGSGFTRFAVVAHRALRPRGATRLPVPLKDAERWG